MMIKLKKSVGVTLSADRIDAMIIDVVQRLSDEDTVTFASSGDTLVLAVLDQGIVEVFVTKVTQVGYVYDPMDDPDILHVPSRAPSSVPSDYAWKPRGWR